MANHYNSASRILRVLRRVQHQIGSVPALHAWATAFDLSTTAHGHEFRVIERIEALQFEINAVRKAMDKSGFSGALYEPSLKRVENILTVHLLVHAWSNSSPQLDESLTMHPLAFCAEIIPEEEVQISVDEIAEIEGLLGSLESTVANLAESDPLAMLILRHIALIRDALLMYAISGAGALRKAVRTATGDLIEASGTIAAHKGDEAVTKLEALWKRFDQISSGLIKADKLSQIANSASEWLGKLLS